MKEELKSKIREHKLYGKQYAYVLDSINPDNIDIDGENMSDKEKLIVLFKDFADVQIMNITRKLFQTSLKGLQIGHRDCLQCSQ